MLRNAWSTYRLLRGARASSWQPCERLRRQQAIRLRPHCARWLFPTRWLAVPEGVDTRIPVPDDVRQLARHNHSLEEDLRVMRRERYTLEVSSAPEDCDVLYHTMHVPFIRQRHGASGYIHRLSHLRRTLRHGSILWVRHGARRIVGGLVQR